MKKVSVKHEELTTTDASKSVVQVEEEIGQRRSYEDKFFALFPAHREENRIEDTDWFCKRVIDQMMARRARVLRSRSRQARRLKDSTNTLIREP